MNKLFSIIVPVYNIEKYIEECIDNVLCQSFQNYELILVDDGSTDSSGKICDDYAKKSDRIVVIHKENGGLSAARNSGIEASTGDYIIFLDGDDYWQGNALEKFNLMIESQNPDYILCADFYGVDGNGNKRTFNLGLSKKEFDKLHGDDALDYIFKNASQNIYSVWRSAYRSKIIRQNNLYFNEKLLLSEDVPWTPRFIKLTKKCVLVNDPFYVYRLDRVGSLFTSRSKLGIKSFLDIMRLEIEEYSKEDSKVNRMMCVNFSNICISNLVMMQKYNAEYYRQIAEIVEHSLILDFTCTYYGKKIKALSLKLGLVKALRRVNLECDIKRFFKKLLNILNLNILVRKLQRK